MLSVVVNLDEAMLLLLLLSVWGVERNGAWLGGVMAEGEVLSE